MAKYLSTKTYGHNIGLSAEFRQKYLCTPPHCRFLHGYSLAFKFTFKCNDLDHRNWVVDLVVLKQLKMWLEEMFDHKVVVDKNERCYKIRRTRIGGSC